MGYCMSSVEGSIKIKVNKIEELISRFNKLGQRKDRLSWITMSVLREADNIGDIFEEIRYDYKIEDDIIIIDEFTGEKLGEDAEIWTAIQDLVEDSYLEMVGEDGDRWRWNFKNGIFDWKSPTYGQLYKI